MVARHAHPLLLLLAAVLAAGAATGCGGESSADQTGLLLVIDGDYSFPDQVDRLVLEIYDVTEQGTHGPRLGEPHEYRAADLDGRSLPLTVSLVDTRDPPAAWLGIHLEAWGPDSLLPVAWVNWARYAVPAGSHSEVTAELEAYPGLFEHAAGAPGAPAGIEDLASADLDGDGDADLALLAAGGEIRTLNNDGGGGFGAGGFSTTVTNAQSVAVRDAGQAAAGDLFVGLAAGTEIVHHPGLSSTGTGLVPAKSPGALNVRDVDGDGAVDLVWLNLVGLDGEQLAALYGTGSGITAEGDQTQAGAAGYPQDWVLADLDGQGARDIVIVNKYESPGDRAPVGALLRSTTDRRAYTATALDDLGASAHQMAQAVTTGDFDGDGNADVAVALEDDTDPRDGASGYAVLWGDGQGGFAARDYFELGHRNTDVAAADFNQDGVDDLVLCNQGTELNDAWTEFHGVAVLLGRGDRSFELLDVLPGVDNPRTLRVDDYDGDGRLDLAVGTDATGIHVLLARP